MQMKMNYLPLASSDYLILPVYVGFFIAFNQRLKHSNDMIPPFYLHHLLKEAFHPHRGM